VDLQHRYNVTGIGVPERRSLSTLFVSDLHLDAAFPAAGEQFRAFLRGPARSAEALYILGDLFDSWIGDDDPDPYRRSICEELRALNSSGVPCYVMHGNRDFLFAADFERRTGCLLLADPAVILLGGERVLLTHGDLLCTGDRSYQRLRSIVRTARWQRRFLALPVATRRALAEAARAGSQRHTSRTIPTIMDVTPTAVVTAMRACGVHTLIHGHTHRPDVHPLEIDGEPARRIVLGAWYEQGSVLRWNAQGYSLETLPTGMPE
jgi:UDP-2,3-diacylglucosamine hydrolase